MTLGPAPDHNPFDAIELDEVLCVEARTYHTHEDGDVYLFLAMDAVTRHAHHHKLSRTNSVDEHMAFLNELFGRYRRFEGQVLAISLPPLHREHIMKAFPHFSDVISEPEKVAEVTQDFHDHFRKMLMGA